LAVITGSRERLSDQVRALVESLCTALPENCATFFVQDEPPSVGGGTTFSLTPWSTEAAPIVINCIESGITLIIGKDSRFEFLVRNDSERQRALDDVQHICASVISGRFSEVHWYAGDEVVRVDGRVCVGGQVLKTSSRSMRRLFSRKEKRVVDYAPYCAGQG
jgi:hypothetical protein